jgi:hypothetical protein
MVRLITLAALALIALSLAGCSDDDDDGDAAATPDVCEQSEAVRQSVQDLADLDVIASGTDGLNAAVENVRTDVSSLKETISDDIEPEVDALETAIDDARDAFANITSDAALSERIADIENALSGIATAAADLRTALDAEC